MIDDEDGPAFAGRPPRQRAHAGRPIDVDALDRRAYVRTLAEWRRARAEGDATAVRRTEDALARLRTRLTTEDLEMIHRIDDG